MTTLIQGGWVIGNDGNEHRLIDNGVVVFDGNKIIHVGKSYSGQVDNYIDARGKIISPGFIDTHFHAQTPIMNSAFTIDVDYKLTFGNPNIPYAPTKEKAKFMALSDENFRSAAEYSLCSLLKSGCTTVLEMGAGRDILVELVGKLGLRAYLGPGFRSAEDYTGEDGTFYNKEWDEERGLKGLEDAVEFIKKYDGLYDGRVKGILNPMQVDFCTPTLLKEVRLMANKIGVLISIHAGQRIYEFQEIIRKYKKTPIGYLESTGLLGPDLIIAHCMMVSGHDWTAYSGDDDIEALARAKTSVAHCPLVAARTSCFLKSFNRYLRAGINVSIGTDTWPLDIISEMRYASIIGKIIDGNSGSATSAQVFNSATIGGATALRRQDLGKLAKGSKADIVIIRTDSFRFTPIADPIKSLVNAGTLDDVETVIVDGNKVVEDGKVLAVDEVSLRSRVLKAAEEEWAKVPQWDWASRSIYDIGPLSFKPVE